MQENTLDPKQKLDLLINSDTTMAIATTVYIIKDGKVLLMNQTKPHTVVDNNYVGVGGKTLIRTYLTQDKEKVRHDIAVSSMMSGIFQIREKMEELAVREVEEEIGLTLDENKLEDIGTTEVRLLNKKSNEIWYIKNYVYYADGTEGKITECDEGILEFVPVDEVKSKKMLPHDRIILGERNPSTYIQSMNDDIHNIKQLRIYQKRKNQGMYILVSDYQSKEYNASGIITEEDEQIPEEYKMLTKNIPKEKLREYLRILGISEKVVGTINKNDIPMDLDSYIR
ncbi:MAG: NUDIX domain-containing protein [Clostridia bacterium]|nr:NUDIX domain-containing protein [Clostridia bacterium]